MPQEDRLMNKINADHCRPLQQQQVVSICPNQMTKVVRREDPVQVL